MPWCAFVTPKGPKSNGYISSFLSCSSNSKSKVTVKVFSKKIGSNISFGSLSSLSLEIPLKALFHYCLGSPALETRLLGLSWCQGEILSFLETFFDEKVGKINEKWPNFCLKFFIYLLSSRILPMGWWKWTMTWFGPSAKTWGSSRLSSIKFTFLEIGYRTFSALSTGFWSIILIIMYY